MNHSIDPACRVRVLAVSPSKSDQTTLTHIFGHTAWEIDVVASVSEACVKMADHPTPVLLCDEQLPDGTWKDLLARTRGVERPPFFIVLSRKADERLWSEVLSLGAYDVLTKPIQPRDVFHSIGTAWRHWMETRKSMTPAYPAVLAVRTGAVA